jgi:hypothetical protein
VTTTNFVLTFASKTMLCNVVHVRSNPLQYLYDAWSIKADLIGFGVRVWPKVHAYAFLRTRSTISESGVMPRWPEKEKGMESMERPKRARKRKPDTAKADLKPSPAPLRRAGCPP